MGAFRVPQHADTERRITLKGRQLPLHEALRQVDPKETMQLRNGKQATLQQIIDALHALEPHTNKRLPAILNRVPMSDTTKAKFSDTHKALDQERENRRNLESAGWKVLIERTAGSSRSFHPRHAAPPSPGAGPATVGTMHPIGAKRCPHPKAEPLDLPWQKQWGDPSVAQVSVALQAGNEFACEPTSGEPGTGCEVDATADIVLMGGTPIEIARASASADASDTKIAGALRVYALGQALPDFSGDGTVNFPKKERSYTSPNVSVPVPIVGPLTLDLGMGASSVMDITADIEQPKTKGKSVACVARLTPEIKTVAAGTASVELASLAKEVVDILLGSFSAGVDVDMTLAHLTVPSDLGLTLNLDPKTGMPSSLDQNAKAEFDAELLNGKMVGWVQLDLHWWTELVAATFGLDSGRHEHEFATWQGEKAQWPLVAAHDTITFGN